MMLELIFAILIAAVVIFIAIRILNSIIFGIALIAAIFIASYILVGVFPNLKSIPLIGHFFNIPSTFGEALNAVKSIFLKIEILDASRDSENNLLISVKNGGMFDLTGFKVFVNNATAKILNSPKEPLKSKETTTIQVEWKNDFSTILVETRQTNAIYSKP